MTEIPNILPGGPPIADTSMPQPQASFFDSTDGHGPRGIWAKKPMPFAAPFNNTMMALGGWSARERGVAAAVGISEITSNPTLAAAVEANITNILGTGLVLSSRPDFKRLGISRDAARELSTQIEREWAAYAANPAACDFSGRSNMHVMARHVLLDVLLQGESVVTIDSARGAGWLTKASVLAPQQLDATITKRDGDEWVLNGVCFRNGRRVAYYLRRLPLADQTTTPIAIRVPAKTGWGRDKVLHIANLPETRAVRGLSVLVNMLTSSAEREDLAQNMVQNAALSSAFAMTLESSMPPAAAVGGLSTSDSLSGMHDWNQARGDWYSAATVKPSSGQIAVLPIGDKLHFNSVNNPAPGIQQFDHALALKSAVSAGVAGTDITGDFSAINFASSRMQAELPYRIALRRREEFVVPFYQGIFKAWLEEAVSMGRIELPDNAQPFHGYEDAWCASKWIGIGRPQPDEKKSADAAVLRMQNGLSTLENELSAQGIDLDSHLEQIVAERELLAKHGLSHLLMGNVQTKITIAENDPEDQEEAPARQKPGKSQRTGIRQTPKRHNDDEEDL